jgi:hypothetical protein
MTDSLTSDGYTQPHSYGDIPVLPTSNTLDVSIYSTARTLACRVQL